MNPYFDTSHLAGALLLVPVLAWGVMEASHLDNRREGAARVGDAGRRMAPTVPTPGGTSGWSRSSGNHYPVTR
jgi:hypothetical protein